MPYWMGYDNDAGRALRKPLFWIKYDDLRDALAKKEAFTCKQRCSKDLI